MNHFHKPIIATFLLLTALFCGLKAQDELNCYDYEDIEQAVTVGVSSGHQPGTVVLEQEGLIAILEEFDRGGNAAPVFGDAAILLQTAGTAIDPNLISGRHLLLEDISVRFSFERSGLVVNQLCFNYWNTGGMLNLSVNGQALVIGENLGRLNGQEIAPGVTIEVDPLLTGVVNAGSICLRGRINTLLFGGERVLIDGLCYGVEEVIEGCFIANLIVEPRPCNADGQFFVDLSFSAENPGNQGFTIRGNGRVYGSFSYEEPFVTIGPLAGDGELAYEFVVIDNENPDCRAAVEFGRLDCSYECALEGLTAYVQNCIPNLRPQLIVDFSFRSPLRSRRFDLFLNGERYGDFSYLDLPLRLDRFPQTDVLHVRVSERNWPQCSLRTVAEFRDCPGSNCIDFNELEPGTVWGREGGHEPGDFVYEKDGVKTTVEKFHYFDGSTDFWNVKVEEDIFGNTFPQMDGNELFISNINLKFDFSQLERQVTGLCFDFVDGGGEENLSVNGQPVKVLRALQELHGQEVAPGVFLSITPYTNSTIPAGRLCLRGKIESLLIGGQEFAFDNLCLRLEEQTDCSISDLVVRPLPCTPNGVYYAEMKFAVEAPASEHFIVLVDGERFGKFAYAEGFPKIGPFAGDERAYHLIEVFDSADPLCRSRFLLGPVSCRPECGIGNLQALIKSCNDDGSYNLWMDFDRRNSLQNSFDLFLEGQFYGYYRYDQLPLLIEGFVPFTDGLEFEVMVCENDQPECCLSVPVKLRCPEECRIYDLKVAATPCNDAGQYFVELNFQYENVSEVFSIWINGNEAATYSYDELPLRLGPFPAPLEQALEIKVKDRGQNGCYAEAKLGPVYCDCRIYNLRKEIVCHAEDATYDLYLKFDHVHTHSDGFKVVVDGTEYGPYAYSDLPVKIAGLPWTEPAYHKLVVCDLAEENACCAEMQYQIECQDELCRIGELRTEVSECDDNRQYYIKLDFAHENTSGQFWVTTNVIRQAFGPFSYNDLPVEIGPLPAHDEINVAVTVKDAEFQDCFRRQTIGVIDCRPETCRLYDFQHGEVICDPTAPNRVFDVKIDFRHENTASEYFSVVADHGWTKKFKYSELPVLLENVPVPEGQDWAAIRICDTEIEGCCLEAKIRIPCPPGPCEIGELQTQVSECENGAFRVKLNFRHANTGGKFWVTTNVSDQAFGPYTYDQLPVEIGPLPGTGEEVILTVRDETYPNCGRRKSLGVIDCRPDCRLFELRHSEVACNPENNTFSVKIDFEVEGPHSDYYVITLENGRQGRFKYTDLPLVLENVPYPAGTNQFRFKICDARIDGCCLRGQIEIPCPTPACEIGPLQLEPTDCDSDGQFMVDIKFRHAGAGERFGLFVNEDLVGRFRYDELPLRVGPYPGDGSTVLEFRVVDGAQECESKGRLEAVSCGDECAIRQVIAETHDCEDGQYLVDLEVRATNPGPLGYYVFADGQLTGPHSYSEPFITLGPFPGDGRTVVDMLILDISDPSCFGYIEVGPVDCEDRCVIDNIYLEARPCTADATFRLDIEVEATNPGDQGFRVLVNGESFGENFSYESEFVTVGPLPADGETIFEVAVVDNRYPDCVKVRRLGPVFCQLENVWPGDANSDNLVQHVDLLNIGLAYHVQGPPRTESTDMARWEGVFATPWAQNFANGLNYKHADCNGDGLIDEEDARVIVQNYGLNHGEQRAVADLPTTDTDPPIFAQVPQPGDVLDGEEFHIPIHLGEAAAAVKDIYGIAFSLYFDPDFIDPASLWIEYPASWLGERSINMITLDKIFTEGRIEIAMTRTDLNEVSGYGQIAILHGIIDDIAGRQGTDINIRHILAIDRVQNQLPIRLTSERFGIEPDEEPPGNIESNIQVYPNPANDWVMIRNNFNQPIESIEVFNANGQRIRSRQEETDRVSLAGLESGIYFLRLKLGGVVVHKKLIKE